MRHVYFSKKNRSSNLLHIETEGCIVNIRIGLKNMYNQNVTSIEIIKDDNTELIGSINNRVQWIDK